MPPLAPLAPQYRMLARFLGWLSAAVGLSLLTPNEGIFYQVSEFVLGPLVWCFSYCVLGVLLVLTTHFHYSRCAIVSMVLLCVLWAASAFLMVISGPPGTFTYAAFVVFAAFARIIWHETRKTDSAA